MPLKTRARVRALFNSLRGTVCEELALLLFTEDSVPQVWPPVLWLRLFPTSILFALLRALLAEVAAQLRELGGVMQAIAQPRLDASAASLAVARRRVSRPDTFRSSCAQASKLPYLFHPVLDLLLPCAITEVRGILCSSR